MNRAFENYRIINYFREAIDIFCSAVAPNEISVQIRVDPW